MNTDSLSERPRFLLREAGERERLHGAYLFYGPRGTGKLREAVALAKSLNCLSSKQPGGDACDLCLSCKKIEGSNHPDVRIVGPEDGEIRIDQIRNLQGDIFFKPLEGRKKVYILTEADRMTTQTANAFLKTLEEPPEGVHFILITEESHSLLPTLLSRCQKVRFHSGTTFPPTRDNPGPISREALLAALSEGRGGMDRLMESAEAISKTEGATEEMLLWITASLRDEIVRRETGQTEFPDDPHVGQTIGSDSGLEPLAVLKKVTDSMRSEELFDAFEWVRRIQKGLDRNVNKRLALETLFMRLATYRKQVQHDDVSRRTDHVGTGYASGNKGSGRRHPTPGAGQEGSR
jgi:DNA polymerase III delta' subunit